MKQTYEAPKLEVIAYSLHEADCGKLQRQGV